MRNEPRKESRLREGREGSGGEAEVRKREREGGRERTILVLRRQGWSAAGGGEGRWKGGLRSAPSRACCFRCRLGLGLRLSTEWRSEQDVKSHTSVVTALSGFAHLQPAVLLIRFFFFFFF